MHVPFHRSNTSPSLPVIHEDENTLPSSSSSSENAAVHSSSTSTRRMDNRFFSSSFSLSHENPTTASSSSIGEIKEQEDDDDFDDDDDNDTAMAVYEGLVPASVQHQRREAQENAVAARQAAVTGAFINAAAATAAATAAADAVVNENNNNNNNARPAASRSRSSNRSNNRGNNIENDESTDNKDTSFCSPHNRMRWILFWLWCNALGLAACYTVTKLQHDKQAAAPPNPWKPVGQALDPEAFRDASHAGAVRYGYATVLSRDGTTMAVSAPWEDEVGTVRLYRLLADEWHRLGPVLYGTRRQAAFGTAVALSATGQRVAIGSPNTITGQVQVFDYQPKNDTWQPVGQTLLEGETRGEDFGSALSLSADGTVLAVGGPGYRNNATLGGPGNHDNAGVVRVFAYIMSSADNQAVLPGAPAQWVQLGMPFEGTPYSKLGFDLALASSYSSVSYSKATTTSGSTIITARLVVGAPFDSDLVYFGGKVQVYDYDYNSDVWYPLGPAFRGNQIDGRFGWSVDISASGRHVAMGSPTNNKGGDAAGLIVVYRQNTNKKEDDAEEEWTLMGSEILGQDIAGWFGNTVALSANGQRVVGSHWMGDLGQERSGGGYVRVLEYVLDEWRPVGREILGQALFDPAGTSLGFSANGNRVVSNIREEENAFNSARVQAFSLSFDNDDAAV